MTNTISIFILPPSFQALAERLSGRGETEATVKRRTQDAVQELSHYQEYDYMLVNDDIDTALQELLMIIRVVRHQYVIQNDQFDDLVKQLLLQAGNIK